MWDYNQLKTMLSLKDHFEVQKLRTQQGFKSSSVSKHMIFTGNPGTGKQQLLELSLNI